MVNEPSWDALPYAPALAEGVIALCLRNWPGAEIGDPDYHRWQYQENPAGSALSALARERSSAQIIGQFGAIPLRMWADGEERLAALGLNVVTDEAHRGRGVFVALGRAAGERMARAAVSFAWAMPNPDSFPGFIRHLGYTHAGDVPLLVRPVNVRRLVGERLRVPGAGPLAAVLSGRLFPPLPNVAQRVEDVAVQRIDGFDGGFDRFWQRVRGRERVMVVRDTAYLEWRFRRVPLRRYECFRATVDGEQRGYVIVRAAEIMGMRAGLVVDFLVEPSPDGPRVGGALLAETLAYFADKEVDLLASLMLPHTLEYRLLRRAGFWALPRALLPQRFRLVARDGPIVRDLRNWFFTMGDYDVV